VSAAGPGSRAGSLPGGPAPQGRSSPVAPRLLCQVDADGWNVLAFEYIPGQHADYTPGSDDLPKVVHAMRQLETIPCPDLPLKRAEQRWADYVDDTAGHPPADAEAWAQQSPAWTTAPRKAIDTFTQANSRLWEQIARDDPQHWKKKTAAAARQLADHRSQ
jgi:hypothetical protein